MLTMIPDLQVDWDMITIAGKIRVYRPASVSPSQWIWFWGERGKNSEDYQIGYQAGYRDGKRQR